ncbi:hypothetical protein GTQ40_07075 [Flavobacteriaceae bacterium R38]|nr:hypothetical protein [Flavobacteriaceae bacterium R38]
MASKRSVSLKMRIVHRYLGFFLVGIMAVYALSGIVLIFRDTDIFKKTIEIEKQVAPNLKKNELGPQLKLRRLKVEKVDGNIYHFNNGTYNVDTGVANYTIKRLPFVLDKMAHLHKSKSGEPLFFLNIFFGLSLFFFVVSAFWMYLPKTPVFKKGLYFTFAGIVLTLILLFV